MCHLTHVAVKWPLQNFSAQLHTLDLSVFIANRSKDALLTRKAVLWRVNLRAPALDEHNMREPPLQFHIKVAFFSLPPLCF